MYSNDSLLDKLIFSSTEHGRIMLYETGESDRARGIVSKRALGKFGTLEFRELRDEAYSFGFTDFRIEEDMRLTTMLEVPYLGVVVNLGDPFGYSQEGLRPGSLKEAGCAVLSLPHLHMNGKLYKGFRYSMFGIFFNSRYLEEWEEAFPTLSKLHEKTEKGIHVYDRVELADPGVIRGLIDDITAKMEKNESNRLYRKNRINELLLKIFEQYEGSASRVKLYATDIETLTEVRNFLTDHPEAIGITLKQIAHDAGMNVFKLKYGFKKLFGSPVFTFFQKVRMDRAKQLLAERKKSVAEISTLLGYKNVSSFSAAFKKWFGHPPSDIW